MVNPTDKFFNQDHDPSEIHLEGILREFAGPAPLPRGEFKRSVRERFLEAEKVSPKAFKSCPDSSSRFDDQGRSFPDSMIEDVLREMPTETAARPEFRAALKEAFVASKLSEGQSPLGLKGHWKPVVEETDAVRDKLSVELSSTAERRRTAESTGAPLSVRETPSPIRSGAFSWQVLTGLVAVAAATILLILNDSTGVDDFEGSSIAGSSRWSVAVKGSEFEVDHVRIKGSDEPRLVKAVNHGAHHLASLEGSAELQLDQLLRLGMDPESKLEIPSLAPSGDDLVFQLSEGTLHLMTAREHPDQSLVVQTPHARVRIHGSVLSIEVVKGKGTCICVALGEAKVEVLSGSHEEVLVGEDSTCFVFTEDSEPLFGPSSEIVAAGHGANLRAFYDETF